ncbi:hypothetical protein M0805_004868 [Coniferiporia weirii]|nr:hypothetical protein M0805_004868 [Coniferiporia weirii]
MKCGFLYPFFSLASLSLVSALGPEAGQIKNLVTFGDSYTDVVSTGDAGVAWPVYAAGYGGFTLFPFARSGATCSNNLTDRPYPPVFGSQLPLFFEELANGTLRALAEDQRSTVYTLWIGTNDLGASALLTGGQAPGVTVVDTTACAVNWVQALYEKGARNFVFQNMIPLEKTILYSANTYPNRYWALAHNATDWSLAMTEMTTAGNAIAKLMLENLARTLLDAHIGLFDSHALFTDIIAHPASYLNGTAPLSVVDPIDMCVYQLGDTTGVTANCTVATGTDRDSYLWYDELHPSEQTDRVIARQITNAILRTSEKWTTWFS